MKKKWYVSADQIVLLEWRGIVAETAHEAIDYAHGQDPDEDSEVIDNRNYEATELLTIVISDTVRLLQVRGLPPGRPDNELTVERLTELINATRNRDGWPEGMTMSQAEYWAVQDVDTEMEVH